MANHASTKKRIRRDTRVRIENKSKKTRLKSLIKSLAQSMESGEKNVELFQKVQSYVDKCGRVGIVHHANASRKISKMSKTFHSAA